MKVCTDSFEVICPVMWARIVMKKDIFLKNKPLIHFHT